MFDIILVGEKLGHSSSTWIIYNYTYLWCQSPRQFDFCSLIIFLKYVPKMIWIRKVTYRLPIIHVDSNFERHCETANGSLCFSMQLLTLRNHTHMYMYKCKHVQNMYIRTNVNLCNLQVTKNMCTCSDGVLYFCLLQVCNLEVTKNICICTDGVIYFCFLYLCNLEVTKKSGYV